MTIATIATTFCTIALSTGIVHESVAQQAKTFAAAKEIVIQFHKSHSSGFSNATEAKDTLEVRKNRMTCAAGNPRDCKLTSVHPSFVVSPARVRGDKIEIYMTTYENVPREDGQPGQKVERVYRSYIIEYKAGRWGTPVSNLMSVF